MSGEQLVPRRAAVSILVGGGEINPFNGHCAVAPKDHIAASCFMVASNITPSSALEFQKRPSLGAWAQEIHQFKC